MSCRSPPLQLAIVQLNLALNQFVSDVFTFAACSSLDSKDQLYFSLFKYTINNGLLLVLYKRNIKSIEIGVLFESYFIGHPCFMLQLSFICVLLQLLVCMYHIYNALAESRNLNSAIKPLGSENEHKIHPESNFPYLTSGIGHFPYFNVRLQKRRRRRRRRRRSSSI